MLIFEKNQLKKIGNSYYILVPKEMRDKKIILMNEDEYNFQKDKDIEVILETQLKNNLNSEEVYNKLNYIENQLTVEDTYRREKTDIQGFYNDYLLTRNTFFKFKKEVEALIQKE